MSSIASSPVGVPAQRGVCPADGHLWMRGYQGELAWVVCLRCGTPGVCKGCLAARGDAVAGLPDIYCTLHAASRCDVLPSAVEVARRLVCLAGTIPSALWHLDRSARCERAVVLREGYQVHVTHATHCNHWRLVVYRSGQDAPVFFAEGRSDALHLGSVQPGVWMTDVLAAVTWRDVGEVVPCS